MVSAAGLAPAITWSQARHVAPTLRANGPDGCYIRAADTQDLTLARSCGKSFVIGGPEGSCTLNPPADNGALCWLSYESRNGLPARKRPPAFASKAGFGAASFTRHVVASEGWWEVLVTLQFVASDTYLKTPDLQSSSRITSPGSCL